MTATVVVVRSLLSRVDLISPQPLHLPLYVPHHGVPRSRVLYRSGELLALQLFLGRRVLLVGAEDEEERLGINSIESQQDDQQS